MIVRPALGVLVLLLFFSIAHQTTTLPPAASELTSDHHHHHVGDEIDESSSRNESHYDLETHQSPGGDHDSSATSQPDFHQADHEVAVASGYDQHEDELSTGISLPEQQQPIGHQRKPKLNKDKEYFNHEIARRACAFDRGCQRIERLNNTFLGYCTRYKMENLFSSEISDAIMHKSSRECERILDEFIQLDETINRFYELFRNLLTRYNCHNGYSVKWTCEDCKKAYLDWLCATSLPYYMKGEQVKPCISFCERVEQRCPYLHPITKEQYGGQPVFICRESGRTDPNIPFMPEITPDMPYSDPAKCYDLCHLSQNRTELFIDSLSKYDPNKCPDKNQVAEQVKNEYAACQVSAAASATNKNTRLNKTDIDQDQLAGAGADEQQPAETTNQTSGSRTSANSRQQPAIDVHIKKLNELREVLTVYKNQRKHKFAHH